MVDPERIFIEDRGQQFIQEGREEIGGGIEPVP